jgi:hypothetical protein
MRKYRQLEGVKTQHSSELPSANAGVGSWMSVRSSLAARPPDPEKRTILLIDQSLGTSAFCRAERNAIQRVVIRWLKPCSWSIPITPAHGVWGINEQEQ